MVHTSKDSKKKLPTTPWGQLPLRLRVLFITGAQRTGGWLAEAFAADSASEVALEEAKGIAAGVARLRDDVFDAVLISHEGETLDALELLDAIRTGSSDEQPIVVLGAQSEQELAALCFEAGADVYVCVHTTTTRALIWQVARARERHQLIAENRRLRQAQQHRLQLEHDEAARLLQQQRALITDLESIRHEGSVERPPSASDGSPNLPPVVEFADLPVALVAHYRDLLRAYVIMGSGNLSDEMQRLADLLATANVTSQQAMRLHLRVLEETVQGLGSRSARHVLNRADLLILEVMMNLAEGYRDRLREHFYPPVQQLLPGFDALACQKAA